MVSVGENMKTLFFLIKYKNFLNQFQEHFLWISESGESFQIVETNLTRLSKIESDIVKNFALEKIQELNIGNIEG